MKLINHKNSFGKIQKNLNKRTGSNKCKYNPKIGKGRSINKAVSETSKEKTGFEYIGTTIKIEKKNNNQ